MPAKIDRAKRELSKHLDALVERIRKKYKLTKLQAMFVLRDLTNWI